MSRDRESVEFNVHVSFNVETLTETFNARADRLCTLSLLLMGSAVLSSFANAVWLGLLITTITAVQFVYRFGEAAGAAKAQKHRYATLKRRMNKLTDDELTDQFLIIQEQDSRPLTSIVTISHNRACFALGMEDQCKDLSGFERFIAFISGGSPCVKPSAPKDAKKDASLEKAGPVE